VTTATEIAGTELKLTATVEDGVLTIRWDKMPTAFFFHDGYGALLRLGSGETDGMVELHRVQIGNDPESIGHVEPLI
jgi:hypothetical protein